MVEVQKRSKKIPFRGVAKKITTWPSSLLLITLGNEDQRKGVLGALIAKLLTLPATFVFHIVISRRLGSTMVGEFYLGLAVTTLLGVATRLGLEAPLLRDTAQAIRSGCLQAARIRFLECALAVTVLSLAVSFLMVGIADIVAAFLFNKPAVGQVLRCFALSISASSLLQMASSVLKGAGKAALAFFLEMPAIIFVFLLILLTLSRHIHGPSGAAAAYTICSCLVSVAAVLTAWFNMRSPEQPENKLLIQRRTMMNTLHSSYRFLKAVRSLIHRNRPFYYNDLLVAFVGNLDSLLLGMWASERDIGLFNAVLRLSIVSTWFRIPIYTAGAPNMVGFWTEGRLGDLQSLAVRASRSVCLATLPVFFIFMLFPKWCLLPFGPEFPVASGALLIVSIGKCFETALGPSRELLVFCGQERSAVKCIALTCLLQLALGALLVPTFGFLGAAIVNACITINLALFTANCVRQRIGIPCWAAASVSTAT